MNKWIRLGLVIGMCGATAQAQDKDVELNTLQQKASYALGVDLGRNFSEDTLNIEPDLFILGIRDAMEKKSRLDGEEMEKALMAYREQLRERHEAQMENFASKSLQEGKAFLRQNAEKPGIKITESGLQYEVLAEGEGETPTTDDSVKVNYTGMLINGEIFDSTKERGEPITFPVDRVIPGWIEALQMMKEGAKYRLYIPPELAYGERGAPPMIGPNATLIFDIELLGIEEK